MRKYFYYIQKLLSDSAKKFHIIDTSEVLRYIFIVPLSIYQFRRISTNINVATIIIHQLLTRISYGYKEFSKNQQKYSLGMG